MKTNMFRKNKILRSIIIIVLLILSGLAIISFTLSRKYINEDKNMNAKDKEIIEKVIELAKDKVGLQYVWGGKGEVMTQDRLTELKDFYGEENYPLNSKDYIGEQAFDCSGLTYWLYKEVIGEDIGLSTTKQEEVLKNHIIDKEDIQPGDLVYTPGHVVLYIGKGKIINAQNKYKYPLGGVKGGRLWLSEKSTIYRPIDYINEK